MDREKIIKAMEWCRENPCNGCPYEQNKDAEGRCTISDDTIALLKEQETSNLYKCPNCGTWVSAENVVRCRDCKHYMTIHCTCDGCCISDDWFCADGEKEGGKET